MKTIQPKPKPGVKNKKAVLGGGNFFLFEACFWRIIGVEKVEVGFAGGSHTSPDTEIVMDEEQEDTGHSQVVEVTYNPDRVTFKQLLEVMMMLHNNTTHTK